MAKPTDKAPGIDAFLNQLSGSNRRECIEADICVFCRKPAKEFRDGLSRKEYTISGMCQTCQGETFGTEED